jgi:hypothetical protein
MILSEAINWLESRFAVDEAVCAASIQACFQRRHQVYCAERGFEIGTGAIEQYRIR